MPPISAATFYNSVKSKKHLYLACLKHYSDTVSQRRLNALLTPSTAKQGVHAFFQAVLDELDHPRTPRVCLMAGSLSGDVLAERDLRLYVVAEMEMFVGCLAKRLEAGKTTGELPQDFDVDAAAQVILTYLQGLFRTIRVLHDRAQVERQLKMLLAGLGL